MPAVLPTLYRDLLRLGRQLDAAPLSKALLLAQPARLFDHRSQELVALPELDGEDGEWLARLHAFNRGEYYVPSASARAAVLDSRYSDATAVDPVDLGLRALRVMSMAAAAGAALASQQRAVQSVPEPPSLPVRLSDGEVRVGDLLLTHPISCLHQPILHRSVILLTDVDAVAGVIINQPQGRSLGDAVGSTGRAAIGDTICASPLHVGGDCQAGMLMLLHELPGLAGSTAVTDGLFVTNEVSEVRTALDTQAASSGRGSSDGGDGGGARVKALAGYAGWARHQLEAELQRNVWFHVEADDADVVALALREEEDAAAPSVADGEQEGTDDTAGGAGMWSAAMRALGGEHVKFAEFPAKEEVVWREVQALWEQQRELLQRRIDLQSTGSGPERD
jgi:putative AlgH/UPF0301 family transcriptional regulator